MVYKVDQNQKELIEAAKKLGFSVKNTAMVKDGFVDVVLGIHGLNFLIEIKNPSGPSTQQKLTIMEEKFHREWNGSTHIVKTIDDLILIKKEALQMSQVLKALEKEYIKPATTLFTYN